MHKFNYRSPRYVVDLPVQLILDGLVIDARCREISREGMQLEVSQSLPANFEGLALLEWRGSRLELRVRVAHTGSPQDAMRFLFESEKERSAIAALVARLASRSGEPGLVPVR